MGADVLNERPVEAVAAEGLCVADNDEFHAGACHGDIHAPQVAQEADGAVGIVAHEADNDNIAFLTLEAVDGADGDVAFQLPEIVLHLEQPPQQASLSAVGGDDAEVDAFAFNFLGRNHLDVVAQGVDDDAGLLGVGD